MEFLFTDSKLNTFKPSAIETGNCSNLSKTSNGSIIATILNKGVTIFQKKGLKYFTKEISSINHENLLFNTSFVNENDDLYLSTQDGRLFFSKNYLQDNTTFKEIKFETPIGTINTLFIKKEKIWIGTTNGLFVYNTKTNLLSEILLESNLHSDENLNIATIDINKDTFYIGTFNGLYIAKNFIDKELQFEKITTYKGENEDINVITSNRVYDTYTDGNLLWIGTNNLDLITLKDPVFKNLNTSTKIALNNAFILSFTKNEDYLFVGTRKGINCINKQ